MKVLKLISNVVSFVAGTVGYLFNYPVTLIRDMIYPRTKNQQTIIIPPTKTLTANGKPTWHVKNVLSTPISIGDASNQWDINAKNRNYHGNSELLENLIKTPSISNDELYKFFVNHQIRLTGGFFINVKTDLPTILAEEFTQARKVTIQDFYKENYLLQADIAWKENCRDNIIHKNIELLVNLITNNLVTQVEIYQFLMRHDIRKDGDFFVKNGKKTEVANILEAVSACTVSQFFNKNYLQNFNAQWNYNASKKDDVSNDKLLEALIRNTDIADSELAKLFKDIQLRPQGGWFLYNGRKTKIALLLGAMRKDFADSFFEIQPAAKVNIPSKGKAEALDPINHITTINCHGSFSTETFTLPDNVFVLAPHPKGFKVPYVLLSPPNNETFEEIIYSAKPNSFPEPSSSGWYLYRPNELIPNVAFSPWSCDADRKKEYKQWLGRIPDEDKLQVKLDINGMPPVFAQVRARDSSNKITSYNGKNKTKFKVFGCTDLKTITNELKTNASPSNPVILISFSCNAGSCNQSITVNKHKTTNISGILANK